MARREHTPAPPQEGPEAGLASPRKAKLPAGDTFTFSLRPIPPFRLGLTVWLLRRLAINEMDRWDGRTYRRVLTVGDEAVDVSVRQTPRPEAPELRVEVSVDREQPSAAAEASVRAQLLRLLGLEIDLGPFYELAARKPHLLRLVQPFIGAKPPRFSSPYEALVNGIACQQLSLHVGITVLNRLTAAYGRPFGPSRAFPRPEDLAHADPGSLRSLGFSLQKATNVIRLSQRLADGDLDLGGMERLDDAALVAELDRLPGVGRWTAEYAALRGFGRLDVFPGDDVGAQARIEEWLGLERRPGYQEVADVLDDLRPYRGLVYFFLLLRRLAEEGRLDGEGDGGDRTGKRAETDEPGGAA